MKNLSINDAVLAIVSNSLCNAVAKFENRTPKPLDLGAKGIKRRSSTIELPFKQEVPLATDTFFAFISTLIKSDSFANGDRLSLHSPDGLSEKAFKTRGCLKYVTLSYKDMPIYIELDTDCIATVYWSNHEQIV